MNPFILLFMLCGLYLYYIIQTDTGRKKNKWKNPLKIKRIKTRTDIENICLIIKYKSLLATDSALVFYINDWVFFFTWLKFNNSENKHI